jgi:hypothetical protein
MTLENVQRPESAAAADDRLSLSFSSFSMNEIRQTIKLAAADLKDGIVQPLQIDDASKKAENYAAKAEKGEKSEKTEKSDQQRMDERIERAFGKEVLDHINDKDWLLDHSDQVKRGFNRIFDTRGEEYSVGQIAGRLNDLSGGHIYGESSKGVSNPFSTDLPDDHFRVYIKRDNWFHKEVFHETTKHTGIGLERRTRD